MDIGRKALVARAAEIGSFAALAIALSGCSEVGSLRTAEVLPPGQTEWHFALGAPARSRDLFFSSAPGETSAATQFGLRRGFRARWDVGFTMGGPLYPSLGAAAVKQLGGGSVVHSGLDLGFVLLPLQQGFETSVGFLFDLGGERARAIARVGSRTGTFFGGVGGTEGTIFLDASLGLELGLGRATRMRLEVGAERYAFFGPPLFRFGLGFGWRSAPTDEAARRSRPALPAG